MSTIGRVRGERGDHPTPRVAPGGGASEGRWRSSGAGDLPDLFREVTERRVRLVLTCPGAPPREVIVDVGSPPGCWLDGAEARWPLWRGVPLVHANRMDPFRRLHADLSAALYAPGVFADRDALRLVLDEMTAFVRETAEAAALRADPAARAEAMRFLPHARWFVYGAILGDSSGRVAQLAQASPGALIFAHALAERAAPGPDGPSARLLADVRAGRRLDRVLDDALAAWLEEVRVPRRGEPAIWGRVRGASAPELAKILADQRLLLRRAGPRVGSTLLWWPPPLAFVPEDIPRPTRANARWFLLVKSRPLLEDPTPGERGREGAAAVVARHGEALFRGEHRSAGLLRALVEGLVRYASLTGVPLERGSSLRRVRSGLDALARDFGLRAFERANGRVTLTTPLPSPVPAEWVSHAGDRVSQLRSAGALFEEGEELRHCVGSCLSRALEGHALYFRARVGGERLTLELSLADGRWNPTELKGRSNAPPSPGAVAELDRWVAALEGGGDGAWRPAAPPEAARS